MMAELHQQTVLDRTIIDGAALVKAASSPVTVTSLAVTKLIETQIEAFEQDYDLTKPAQRRKAALRMSWLLGTDEGWTNSDIRNLISGISKIDFKGLDDYTKIRGLFTQPSSKLKAAFDNLLKNLNAKFVCEEKRAQFMVQGREYWMGGIPNYTHRIYFSPKVDSVPEILNQLSDQLRELKIHFFLKLCYSIDRPQAIARVDKFNLTFSEADIDPVITLVKKIYHDNKINFAGRLTAAASNIVLADGIGLAKEVSRDQSPTANLVSNYRQALNSWFENETLSARFEELKAENPFEESLYYYFLRKALLEADWSSVFPDIDQEETAILADIYLKVFSRDTLELPEETLENFIDQLEKSKLPKNKFTTEKIRARAKETAFAVPINDVRQFFDDSLFMATQGRLDTSVVLADLFLQAYREEGTGKTVLTKLMQELQS